jgi:hypothetical protein
MKQAHERTPRVVAWCVAAVVISAGGWATPSRAQVNKAGPAPQREEAPQTSDTAADVSTFWAWQRNDAQEKLLYLTSELVEPDGKSKPETKLDERFLADMTTLGKAARLALEQLAGDSAERASLEKALGAFETALAKARTQRTPETLTALRDALAVLVDEMQADPKMASQGAYETLAAALKLVAIEGRKTHVLYDGATAHASDQARSEGTDEKTGNGKPKPNPRESQMCRDPDSSGICPRYNIDRAGKLELQIVIPQDIDFSATISVRARILRNTPVELSVDNYTTVSKSELEKSELATAPGDIFHGKRRMHRIELVDKVRAISESYLRVLPLMAPLSEEALESALYDLKAALDALTAQVDKEFASESALVMLVPSETAYSNAQDKVDRLLSRIEEIRLLTRAGLQALEKVEKCPPAAPPAPDDCRLSQRAFLADLAKQFEAKKYASMALGTPLKDIYTALRFGVRDEALRRMKPAVVHLAAADLKHDDVVELIVRASMERLALGESEQEGEEALIFRFRIRIVERGCTYAIGPQFGMIKRLSDVRVATATDAPSNFRPAPGGAIQFPCRARPSWSDWLIPFPGITAFVLDFDPSQSFELGVGPSLGILNGMLHAGIGWNLFVTEHRPYAFLSLDFLQTVASFGPLFGGSTGDDK